MTRKDKAEIRRIWKSQHRGLAGFGTEANIAQRAECAVDECALMALPGRLNKLLSSDIMQINDYGFDAALGVTPEERRDCMIAMLDAGAFD